MLLNVHIPFHFRVEAIEQLFQPAIETDRCDQNFIYRDPQGRVSRESAENRSYQQARGAPAWTNVWICPDPNGHLKPRDATRGGVNNTAVIRDSGRCRGELGRCLRFARATVEICVKKSLTG
jgi:DNA topoisomerase IB